MNLWFLVVVALAVAGSALPAPCIGAGLLATPPPITTLNPGQSVSLQMFLANSSVLLLNHDNATDAALRLCTAINAATQCLTAGAYLQTLRVTFSAENPQFAFVTCTGADAAGTCQALQQLPEADTTALGIVGVALFTFSPGAKHPAEPSERDPTIAVAVAGAAIVVLVVLGLALWCTQRRAAAASGSSTNNYSSISAKSVTSAGGFGGTAAAGGSGGGKTAAVSSDNLVAAEAERADADGAGLRQSNANGGSRASLSRGRQQEASPLLVDRGPIT
jgi:hypothetical protein